MTWCAIDVTPPPADRDAIATWLVSHTGMAVEERPDGTLVSFAPDADQAARLTQTLQHAFPSGLVTATRPLASIDWSTQWRQGIGVRHFGRLSLAPSWLRHGPAVGEVSIVLDPESAFGSGEHGSTRAALTLLERILKPGERVLDLGSGSGVLAIAAAKLGARVQEPVASACTQTVFADSHKPVASVPATW